MPVELSNSPQMPVAGRALWPAMLKGLHRRCPRCGQGRMFKTFLGVEPQCPSCGLELHHHRADDAPPYFVMFLVGHIIVGLVLATEMEYSPPLWLHAALWIPLTLVLSLLLLPPVKGALIGLQWAFRMHGFDDRPEAVGKAAPTHNAG
jgi:uncharacterized protein (DUF983 family)